MRDFAEKYQARAVGGTGMPPANYAQDQDQDGPAGSIEATDANAEAEADEPVMQLDLQFEPDEVLGHDDELLDHGLDAGAISLEGSLDADGADVGETNSNSEMDDPPPPTDDDVPPAALRAPSGRGDEGDAPPAIYVAEVDAVVVDTPSLAAAQQLDQVSGAEVGTNQVQEPITTEELTVVTLPNGAQEATL